jgi:hypothetical protein
VVELKDHDVFFAAVDARMHLEILDSSLLRLRAALGSGAVETSPLAFYVVLIVAGVRSGEAGAAPGLELPGLGAPDWWKLIEGLRLAATRTGLHRHTQRRLAVSVK